MLTKIMKDKGITINKLVELSGISEPTINRAKKDITKLTFANIINICRTLDILPSDLIPYSIEKNTEIMEFRKMLDYSFAELPDFSADEKKYLADMMNGTLYNPDISPITHLKLNVLDSNKYDGLGAKWNVDVNKLYDKVDNLTAHQAYSLIYKIREWWTTVPDTQKDLDNIF